MRARSVPTRRRRRSALRGAVALALSLLLPVPGVAAAQRLESFPLPSTLGNVDLHTVRLNRTDDLRATVLLPDGYDAQPARRWPVLYLLHGVGDNAGTWAARQYGDVARRARGFPGIIVMPESGRSYDTDAWMGGDRAGANWERYFLDEVLPTVESRYRILPGRQHHAIGGLSMGGYGAVLFAAQLPTYFGTAVSMSGLLDLQDPLSEIWVPFFSRFSYVRTWGPFHGPYVQAHDPMRLLPNLQDTRLYVSSGDGTTVVDPAVPWSLTGSLAGGFAEGASHLTMHRFAGVATAAGLDVSAFGRVGLHAWPYWRRELQRAIAWDVFGTPPALDAAHFEYRTMAPHGNAYGLGFRFAAPPRALLTLRRDGQTLTATGAGTLTVTPGAADADASGAGTRADCAFTAEVPFTHALPVGC